MACGLASFVYCTAMVVLTALKDSEVQLIEDGSLQAASCWLPGLKCEIKAPLEETQWAPVPAHLAVGSSYLGYTLPRLSKPQTAKEPAPAS